MLTSGDYNIPSVDDIHDVLFDENACIQYLFEAQILHTSCHCSRCKEPMKLSNERKTWRCSTSRSGGESSIFKDSFFSKSHLSCNKIMQIGYFWLNRNSTASLVAMSGCSSRTVCSFTGYFRQLAADSLDAEDCTIGGPGIIIEVDESKMGKRKYHRGHRVDGVWLVGGIERTEEKKVFIARVEDRSAETLLALLSRHVLPGSIIYSDMWRGYSRIEECLGLEHHTVNHSVEFITSEGVHTNTIEAT
jgi:transposase-like protein